MNHNLKVKLNKDPFPHLILEDVFTPEELLNVHREIDFLEETNLTLSARTSVKERGWPDGRLVDKSKFSTIHIPEVYQSWQNSTICRKVRELTDQGLFFVFSNVDPRAIEFCLSYKFTELSKINFFRPGDKYDSHRDNSDFTSLIYLYREPKQFQGGLLNFPDYDYSYNCDENSLILFAGYHRHEVTKVSLSFDEEQNYKDIQRISINTFHTLVR